MSANEKTLHTEIPLELNPLEAVLPRFNVKFFVFLFFFCPQTLQVLAYPLVVYMLLLRV